LVEPLDEQFPGVDVVFGEVGGVVGGFFEAAGEHSLEDFGGVAEELFVDCVELFFGAGVDAYDFGTELSGIGVSERSGERGSGSLLAE
jgi:hypothetical protein